MEETLARRDLGDVIAEVDRIARDRADRLTAEEARVILQELDLPGALLEEAVEAIRRRAEKARARRRRVLIGAAVLVAAGAASTAVIVRQGARAAAYARVTGGEAHLAVGSSDGAATETIHRSEAPEAFFTVTLRDAPIGDALPLTCEWLGPDGAVAHQNRWDTKPVDRPVWPTHCRYKLDASARTGAWVVRMKQGDRELARATFTLD